MSMEMSTSSRTRGSSIDDDRVDRGAGLGRVGSLLPLDLLEEHEVGLVQDRQHALAAAARPPVRSAAARPRAPSRCAASSCGRRNARRSSSVRRAPCGEPVVEARADDADRSAGRVEAGAAARRPRRRSGPGKERHSCPGSSSISRRRRPRRCRPRCRRRRARPAITSGVQLKALARASSPRGERTVAPELGAASRRRAVHARMRAARRARADRSAWKGRVSGPSGPVCR